MKRIAMILTAAVLVALLATAGGLAVNLTESGFYKDYAFFAETFGIQSDAILEVDCPADADIAEIMADFEGIDGVKQMLWYGTIASLPTFGGLCDTVKAAEFFRKPLSEGRVRYTLVFLLSFAPLSREVEAFYADLEAAFAGNSTKRIGATEGVRRFIRNPFKTRLSEGAQTTQMLFALPLCAREGYSQRLFAERLAEIEGVTTVISAFTLLKNEALARYALERGIASAIGLGGLVAERDGVIYTLCYVQATTTAQEKIRALRTEFFGDYQV